MLFYIDQSIVVLTKIRGLEHLGIRNPNDTHTHTPGKKQKHLVKVFFLFV